MFKALVLSEERIRRQLRSDLRAIVRHENWPTAGQFDQVLERRGSAVRLCDLERPDLPLGPTRPILSPEETLAEFGRPLARPLEPLLFMQMNGREFPTYTSFHRLHDQYLLRQQDISRALGTWTPEAGDVYIAISGRARELDRLAGVTVIATMIRDFGGYGYVQLNESDSCYISGGAEEFADAIEEAMKAEKCS